MNFSNLFWVLCLIVGSLASPVVARTFTDVEGRTTEGEIVSATANVVKIKKTGGAILEVPVKNLSASDQAYVKQFRADFMKKMMGAKGLSDGVKKTVATDASQKIVAFARANVGKTVGNGECWTLANEAYKNANIKRPSMDLRVWGRTVDFRKEKLQAGDIIELNGATFANGMKFFGNHTSVIVEADDQGNFTVLEQNINGKRFVQKKTYNVKGLKSGSMKIYRYEGTK